MELTCAVASFVSAAFHQNSIPIIQEIKVDNDGEAAVCDVVLRISSEPAIVAPLTIRIDRIEPSAFHYVRTPDLRLDSAMLRNIVEGVTADLVVSVEAPGAGTARHVSTVRVLPPSHWGGVTAAPELLAAFVRPNDPAVDVLLRLAAQKLAAAGKRAAIDGYAEPMRARTWDLAAAIWAAIAEQSIAYVLPPASFERMGQKVRGPSDILARRTATCLDTALLFAACLEQAGLDPVVVLTEGHAFAGVWLRRVDFTSALVDDAQVLRKRRDLQELLLVETTLLTQGRAGRFAAAVAQGAALVEEGSPARLELAVDVRRARLRQIRPLELGDAQGAALPAVPDASPVRMELDEAPSFAEEAPASAVHPGTGTIDRLERWKRKLLDLSLRNKLLNFKDARKSVPLDCPDAGHLEDLLAEGRQFRFMPRAEVLSEGDRRSAALHRDRFQDDGRRRFLSQSLDAGDLHADLTEAELDARLTELFRLTKTAFEEGGANVLFLAFGFLTWTQADGGRACRAPILLVPVSLRRSSVRSGFRLVLHEEEPRFNPTLIEMLRQDFELKMPELERDLPTDASRLAVKRVWQALRTHVRDLKGWEVTEDVVLSTFSFSKFLMWKDLVDRLEQLRQSPVVRHLIDTPKQTYGDASDFPDPRRIDIDFHPREIFAPLSADSSQLAAVMAAERGKDFVLFGPPGTGKSQTIANIVAQCLASGKTVLFVSQKTAALEVVQRRLNEIGLGDYCLEVHSAKAQKSAVLGQLKAAWHDRQAPAVEDWEAATAELGNLRDELNGLVSALHRRRPNGLSAYDAFGRVVAGRDKPAGLQFAWPGGIEHAPEALAALRRLCRELETALKAVGPPAAHPLRGICAREWTPAWRQDLGAAIKDAAGLLPPAAAAASGFASSLGLEFAPSGLADVGALAAFGAALTAEEASPGIAFLGAEAPRRRTALARLVALQQLAEPSCARLGGRYESTAFGLDFRSLLDGWQQATASNLFVRGSRQKRIRDVIAAHARAGAPEDPSEDLRTLAGVAEIIAQAEALSPDLAAFGDLWDGLGTDAARLSSLMRWAEGARVAISGFAAAAGYASDALEDYAIRLWTDHAGLVGTGGEASRAFLALEAAWKGCAPAIGRVGRIAGRDPSSPLPADGPAWVEESLEAFARWTANILKAQAWCFWNQAAAGAREAGLEALVTAVESGTVAAAEIGGAFELAYARWWSDGLVTGDPVLRTFLAERHEDAIDRFRQADAAVTDLSRRIVRGRLRGDVPSPTAFGADPEWGTLARELTKKARHMPLRQLFSDIPTALTRLTPCLMMSPLSIAQYLPADSSAFDVVIFDEASQIPPWDAIGAIARGRQAIIVGDPEQLPPTNVGERGIDDVEDGTDVEDQESILDECLASNIPSRRLEWHYRSRQESLIAFANHAYYKGRLITFPSPRTQDRAVHLVPVPGGVYQRGKGRTNLKEAQAVAQEVARRLRDPAFALGKLSLGVVTFNGEQQRLVENLIDAERRADPEIEAFFDAARWHEPVFVKNLENVQGDERDVILFSVTFAPDETGRPISTISSLNKDGGHRRLNVAITRARREMAIFATLRPDQIVLTGQGSRGVRDFKHFLEYAERGPKALVEASAPLGKGTDSPFEDAVMGELERRGWTLHPQVGVSAFRIDLGVVHPDAPGRYLAGVECDGATYHRSATARDRDRLREAVLTGLGWRIRRVWSTDWWMDAGTAAQRLHDSLAADLDEDRAAVARTTAETRAAQAESTADATGEDASSSHQARAAPEAEAPARPQAPDGRRQPMGPDPVPAEQPRVYADPPPRLAQGALGPGRDYRRADPADCGWPVDASRFYDPGYRATLRAMVSHVVEIEGPLFDDVLVSRIARAHDFQRTGVRIRDAVLACAADVTRTREDGREVFWPAGEPPDCPVAFRPAPGRVRDHADVPLLELAGLARQHGASAADEEAAIRLMAGHFGLGRLREAARARFAEAVRAAAASPSD